jgi:hypothetical protein
VKSKLKDAQMNKNILENAKAYQGKLSPDEIFKIMLDEQKRLKSRQLSLVGRREELLHMDTQQKPNQPPVTQIEETQINSGSTFVDPYIVTDEMIIELLDKLELKWTQNCSDIFDHNSECLRYNIKSLLLLNLMGTDIRSGAERLIDYLENKSDDVKDVDFALAIQHS